MDLAIVSFQKDGSFSSDSVMIYNSVLDVELVNLTVCIFVMFYRTRGKTNTIVSYATEENNNELIMDLFHVRGQFQIEFCRGKNEMNECIRAALPSFTFGQWFQICGTIASMSKRNGTESTLNLYSDGMLLKTVTKHFSKVLSLHQGGTFALGQDQDWPGDGFDEKQSFSGALTEFNLWDYELDARTIGLMANCSTFAKGNVVNWFQPGQWTLEEVNLTSTNSSKICTKDPYFDIFLIEDIIANDEMRDICDSLNGTMDVPMTGEQFQDSLAFQLQLLERNQQDSNFEKSKCLIKSKNSLFHLGHQMNSNKKWINPYTLDPISAKLFLKTHEPYDEEPLCIYNRGTYVDSTSCSERVACGYCKLQPRTVLRLKGLCSVIITIDQSFDTNFVVHGSKNSKPYLSGFMSSDIFFDDHLGTWRFQSFRSDGSFLLLKTTKTNQLPLGRHQWYPGGNSSICNLKVDESIALTLSICKPNEYTCNSGSCVPLSSRCNTAVDCKDKSDEYGCSYLRIGNDYSKTSIPRATNGGPLVIHMNVSVLAFPNIDSYHLKFTADFFLNLRWNDNRISFRDLNEASLLNSLGGEDILKVWTPHLVFFNALGPYTTVVDGKTNMKLLREDEPLLEDMTQSIEALLFSGATNSILMTREYYQDYSCQFDLRYYPFDSQICKLLFDVQGLPDHYTILKPDHNGVEFIGTRSLVEFDILLERLEVFSVNNISEAEVKFVFRRRMEFHVTNTFLQTFILIGIGFMSLYFDVDNFSDRIMVTLTTMLVIATITASIQASLPKTSYYKLIDWWLLFSLNALVLTMCFHTGIAHLCYKAKRAASPALVIKGYRSKSASNLIPSPRVNSLLSNSGFPNEDFRKHFYYRRAHRVNFWGKVAFVALVLTFNVAFWCSALTEYSRPPSDLL